MTNAPMIQRRAGRIPAGATGTAGADRLARVRALDAVRGEAPKGLRVYPDFSRRDLDATAPPEVFAEARRLAPEVEDLDWDEHSVWARLGDYGLGDLLLHHGFRPLAGECPCDDHGHGRLCVHIAAVAFAYLSDSTDLKEARASQPRRPRCPVVRPRRRVGVGAPLDRDAPISEWRNRHVRHRPRRPRRMNPPRGLHPYHRAHVTGVSWSQEREEQEQQE
jgi:hypothetical protein